MNTQISAQNQPQWTWADMLLTYRFWGLMFVYIITAASLSLLNTWLVYFFNANRASISSDMLGLLLIFTSSVSIFPGFYLAWAATRYETKKVLILALIFQLAGALLLVLNDPTPMSLIRFVGAAFLGMGSTAVLLGVPAILASGMGGAQSFVLAFGLFFAVARVTEINSNLLLGYLIEGSGPNAFAVSLPLMAALAMLFLLPVNSQLFAQPPKTRAYSWTVRAWNPVLVGLGSILAPVYYYLIYKFHGEIASLHPSPKILSPGGALGALVIFPTLFSLGLGVVMGFATDSFDYYGWILLLIYFQIPIMLTAVSMTLLVEPLNEHHEVAGKKPVVAPWVIFVFGILFYPAVVGLIQWAINKTAVLEQAKPAESVAE